MKRIVPVALIVILAGVLGWLVFGWSPQQPGHRALEGGTGLQGGDFTLRSIEGPVSLSDYRGKVVLLYFGYTWCPDVCPTSLSLMAQALSQMTERQVRQVQGIFVSVDPERDTPERLAEYTDYFHPNIIGVTGTAEEVAEVAGQYGVAYRKAESDSATGYLVDHSSFTYVLDQEGELVTRLGHGAPPKEILQAVRPLLAGGPPGPEVSDEGRSETR